MIAHWNSRNASACSQTPEDPMKKSLVPERYQHYYQNLHYSPVIDTGAFVFLSGVTAARPNEPVPTDPEAQFHKAFDKLATYLSEAGLGFEHIVELTSFHVDLRKHIDVFSAVKDQYIGEPYPAWSAIGVTEFIPVNALVEMRVVAMR